MTRQMICCDRCDDGGFNYLGMCRCGCHDGTLPHPIWSGSSVPLEKRSLQLQQIPQQGDNTERLPTDAYASQGSKAAVNELLTMKMQQVVQLREKLDDITEMLCEYNGDYTEREDNESYERGYRNGGLALARKIIERINSV